MQQQRLLFRKTSSIYTLSQLIPFNTVKAKSIIGITGLTETGNNTFITPPTGSDVKIGHNFAA